MKRYIIIFVLIFLFIGCEKYIDMEIPDRGRKLVMNCLYSDTGNVIVNISLSKFILDNAPFSAISGAHVYLYENGFIVDTLTEINSGRYCSNGFVPSMNATHKIEAFYGSYSVTAQSFIPKPAEFALEDTTLIQSEFNEALRLRIRINDSANESNYYLIGFETKNLYYEEDHFNPALYFDTEEPYIEAFHNEYGIFSDNLFNGQNQLLSFDLDLYHFVEDSTTVYIKLFSISRDMYMYLLTLTAQQQSMESFFAEPVMVYNNIENGFGIFAGYTFRTDSVIIPKLTDSWDYEKGRN